VIAFAPVYKGPIKPILQLANNFVLFLLRPMDRFFCRTFDHERQMLTLQTFNMYSFLKGMVIQFCLKFSVKLQGKSVFVWHFQM
jgi:hypothetical protein